MSEAHAADTADRLLRTQEVARWLAVSKSTLVRWRQSLEGPQVYWHAVGEPVHLRPLERLAPAHQRRLGDGQPSGDLLRTQEPVRVVSRVRFTRRHTSCSRGCMRLDHI